jgi:lysophospholipase L1-like esterase
MNILIPPRRLNYTYDGLHQSDKGNKKIADMLSKEIMEN